MVTSKTCIGLRCTFDASGSSDSDGNIASTSWNFGDGTGASGAVVVHTYASPGTYDAAVTVTDDDGAQSVARPRSPSSDVAPGRRPRVSCTDGTCQVDGSGSTDADGTIASYAWTFGDGGTSNVATTPAQLHGVGPVHRSASRSPTTAASPTAPRRTSTSPFPPGVGSSAPTLTSRPTTTTTNTVTVPADTRAGDTVLLFATSNGAGSMTMDAPAGWTRVRDANTSSSRSAVWRRTATGTDAGTSVVVTTGALTKTDVVIATYRDLDVASYARADRVHHADGVGARRAPGSCPTGPTSPRPRPGGPLRPASRCVTPTPAPAAATSPSSWLTPMVRCRAGTVGGLTATATGGAVANAVAVTVVLTP